MSASTRCRSIASSRRSSTRSSSRKARGHPMPTLEQYLHRSLAHRLHRLRTTPDDISAALDGKSDDVICRRPDRQSWSAREIICHLRDVEELFLTRFQTILAMDDPEILTFAATPEVLKEWGIGEGVGHLLDPNRWADERQYARSDAGLARAAFRRRRQEVVKLFETLSPGQWRRGGIHLQRGRLTLDEWVASLAAHDDNHLDQMRRALDGRV